MKRFADVARPHFSRVLPEIWSRSFPLVVPPDDKAGLGIIILNSNADTHFFVSAPSPVMEVTNEKPSSFYIHTLAEAGGQLTLLPPERIVVPGETEDGRKLKRGRGKPK